MDRLNDTTGRFCRNADTMLPTTNDTDTSTYSRLHMRTLPDTRIIKRTASSLTLWADRHGPATIDSPSALSPTSMKQKVH